jgi:cyanophycinase-like exopeptidase
VGLPRILTIMGSGETAPTMSKVHRDLISRMGPSPVPAAMLDTPFGFQENADDITAKAVAYFRESVQRDIGVASYRSADDVDPVAYEQMLARLREAAYVFAGPGSPSYALDQWAGSQVPVVLAEKLRTGGAVTFASAAACTLGTYALPVYEVYKVGQRPHWLDGLDLVAELGLRAVVVPHFNNAEGGNHDTRFCYMGERRLSALEAQLPDDVFILGVDEHTACILDLDEGTATIAGIGTVTIRRSGEMSTLAAGDTVPIAKIASMAAAGRAGRTAGSSVGERVEARTAPERSEAADPLLEGIDGCRRDFDAALAARDGRGAVKAVLELDDLLADWSRDTLQSDYLDRGRAALRAMVVQLGEAAAEGLRDPRQVVAPFVEALLDARRDARTGKRFADADALRDRLVAAGVEVRDTPAGTEWVLP